VPDGLNLQRAIRADEPFGEDCAEMERVCTADFEKAHDVADIFEEFREIHEWGRAWDFDAYQAAGHDLDRMAADMHRLRDWHKRVEQRIKLYVPAGILNVDAKLMKARLLPAVTTSLDALRDHLSKLARDTCNTLRQQLSSHIRALGEKPRHLRDFADYITTLRSLEDGRPQSTAQLELLDRMYAMLDDHGVPREYIDQARYDEVRNLSASFVEALATGASRVEAKTPAMAQQADKRLRQLDEELAAVIAELSGGVLVEARTDARTAVARLEDVGKNLDLAAEHAATYGGYLALFGRAGEEPPLLSQAKTLFAMRSELWRSLDKWSEDVATWKASLFEDLDVEAVEAEVARVYKIALKLDKRAKGADEAAAHFRQLVEEFRVYAPLLVELGNKALTQRHWEQIFRGLNQAWYPGRKFTLAALMNMGIAENRAMIAEISGVASGEHSLVVMLRRIIDTWEGMEFDVIPHKRAKNVYILSSLEDVTATLEDNQVTLQSMFASRWVVGIREEVEVWDRRLSLLSEVLDEWVACQRSWMYLEVIFSQPDIQRQLPMEHTKFSAVDKRWKEFMRVTYGEPKVLNAVSDEVLASLVESNRQLDTIQKSLEDYLETKRVAFPRFYFLSNDELLEVAC
jgi:dynein heavy chain